MALTTEKIESNSVGNAIYSPLRNSVLFFQRHDDPFPPATPPPPLKKSKTPPTPHSAPPAVTAASQQQHTTPPKSNSCQPPKKRVTDSGGDAKLAKAAKRAKVVRKLNFDEDKSSPVSGTFIRDPDDEGDDMHQQYQHHPSAVRRGDIDPSLNVVVVSEEARAELAKIENRIGDYVCRLCAQHFDDAFGLAQHRCARIVHVEYRCPECDKVFNCPANLASHRRWHKPRPPPGTKNTAKQPLASKNGNELTKTTVVAPPIDVNSKSRDASTDPSDNDSESTRGTPPPDSLECHLCRKKFAQHFHFRKHLLSHLTTDANGQLESDVLHSVFSKGGVASRLVTTPAEPDGFACTLCGLQFRTKSEMERHAFKHDELQGVQCQYCPSVFYSSAGLTRHVNKHHPSENRQVLLLQVPTVRPMST